MNSKAIRSKAIISEFINQAIEIPGSHFGVVSKSNEIATQQIAETMVQLKERDYWQFETRNQGRVINFDNGSRIIFVHTDRVTKEGKYSGYKLVDEADYPG